MCRCGVVDIVSVRAVCVFADRLTRCRVTNSRVRLTLKSDAVRLVRCDEIVIEQRDVDRTQVSESDTTPTYSKSRADAVGELNCRARAEFELGREMANGVGERVLGPTDGGGSSAHLQLSSYAVLRVLQVS